MGPTLPLASCAHCDAPMSLDRKGGLCEADWMRLPDSARMTIINAWHHGTAARQKAIADAVRLLAAETVEPVGGVL